MCWRSIRGRYYDHFVSHLLLHESIRHSGQERPLTRWTLLLQPFLSMLASSVWNLRSENMVCFLAQILLYSCLPNNFSIFPVSNYGHERPLLSFFSTLKSFTTAQHGLHIFFLELASLGKAELCELCSISVRIGLTFVSRPSVLH